MLWAILSSGRSRPTRHSESPAANTMAWSRCITTRARSLSSSGDLTRRDDPGRLPFPITTPAHGTAFDIAGQNEANVEATGQASRSPAPWPRPFPPRADYGRHPCRQSTGTGWRSVDTVAAEHQPYQNRIELLQGTLDMLILQTLQWGAQHGFGIGQALRVQSGDVLQVETGSLYPALHRMERQGWIVSKWPH